MTALPKFEDLPLRKDGPPYNAWGLYGDDDELGRLNLITPEAVQRGLKAAEHGIVINLNLPLDRQTSFSNGRAGLKHTLVTTPGDQHLDDELSFNTQCSTQWDGFRHFPYKDWPQPGDLAFYNGQTLASAKDPRDSRNGIHNFANHPITSRAHLLDVPRYLAKNGLPPLVQLDNVTPIGPELLTKVAEFEGVEFQPGDICVLRIGHVEAFFDFDAQGDGAAATKVTKFCGVRKAVEVAKWHWERGISAVVTDGVAYECSRDAESKDPIYLHEIFLAGWGMPIGEWFDLRRLSAECDRLGKWTFLFTSMPLNVTGGIASPPNAQAILKLHRGYLGFTPEKTSNLSHSEVLETIGGFPTIYHYAPAPDQARTENGTHTKPLIVCVTGGLHLARVFYGGHAGHAPQDFLAYHLNQCGFSVLSLSYPTETDTANTPIMPLDSKCAHFRIPDWGRQAAETTRRVVDAHRLGPSVVLASWSMGGRMVVPYAVEARRLGLDVQQYISFAATPGFSSIRPLPPGMVCSPAGYFTVPTHLEVFLGQLAEMAQLNGRESIPADIYRREYAGGTPIGLIGLGLKYDAASKQYVPDEVRHEDDTRVLDVGAFPLPTALYPRSIMDPSHSLTDRATWGFLLTYKLEALITEKGGLAKLKGSADADSRWQKLMDLVHKAPERLSQQMSGNHFFFVGEKSAAETAAAMETLTNEAAALQQELAGLLE